MRTITVKISDEKDIERIKDFLDRFKMEYTLNDSDQHDFFSEADMEGFKQTQDLFLAGKSSARDWEDVKKELDAIHD